MNQDELSQAIPPCYTCFIGGYLLSVVLGDGHQPFDSVLGRKCDTCGVHYPNSRTQHKNGPVGNESFEHSSPLMSVENDGNSHRSEQHQDVTDLHSEG